MNNDTKDSSVDEIPQRDVSDSFISSKSNIDLLDGFLNYTGEGRHLYDLIYGYLKKV